MIGKRLEKETVSVIFDSEVSATSAGFSLAYKVISQGLTPIVGTVRIQNVPPGRTKYSIDVERKENYGERV